MVAAAIVRVFHRRQALDQRLLLLELFLLSFQSDYDATNLLEVLTRLLDLQRISLAFVDLRRSGLSAFVDLL